MLVVVEITDDTIKDDTIIDALSLVELVVNKNSMNAPVCVFVIFSRTSNSRKLCLRCPPASSKGNSFKHYKTVFVTSNKKNERSTMQLVFVAPLIYYLQLLPVLACLCSSLNV